MMRALYIAGDSWLHRLPAGAKLAVLAVAGALLFFTRSPWILGPALGVALILPVVAGARWRHWRAQWLGLLPIVAVVCVAAGLFEGWAHATVVLARLLTLIALAWTITLTTRSADLLDAFERALRPLERLGWVDAARVSLALSLTLRFVPELWRRLGDIREAQAARGLSANPVALVVPLAVAALKSADAVAEAIEARGYPPAKSGDDAEGSS